jgi:predicted nucleic acid-binding Zn ribbon protein
VNMTSGNAAEKWLVENDPDYIEHRRDWKQIRPDGTYSRPRQEIPWGLADDLEHLVGLGRMSPDRRATKARGYVGVVDRRACERCHSLFTPTNSWNRFCSDRCRWAAQKKEQRRVAKMSAHSSK